MSRRSTTTRVPRRTISSDHKLIRDDKKIFKFKHWLFSLCSNLTTDAVTAATNTSPCLAHFLEAERRAAAANTRRNRVPLQHHGPDDYSPVHYLTISNSNSLFVNGLVAPHKSPAAPGAANGGIRSGTRILEDGNGFGVPLMFPCLCGQLIK